MAKRNNGFAAKLGAFFGRKKPKRHALPHIYVSTERETKQRKAKAKERSAILRQRSVQEEKAARQAAVVAPTAVKGAGKLSLASAKASAGGSALDEAVSQDDAFIQKTTQKKERKQGRGVGLWTMMRDRLGANAPARAKASTEKVESIDPNKDGFLQRASAVKADEQIVRTESTDLPKKEVPSALDEVMVEKPKDDAKKEEIAKALKENADIRQQEAPVPAPKSEKPLKKKVHMKQFETKKGFRAFLTSINYIGMGRERMMFIQNMATMLNAGLPLTDSLRTLVLETHNRSMRKLIQRIVDAVENGSPLWRAMEAQNFFSLHALALVRIGEEAGNLAENMGYLAEQDEKDHALRSKVKMAMIYPTIVLIIMFIIVVGLGMFVLPNLVGVLFSLNVKLPLITRIVIWFSDMFVAHGTVAIPSVIVGFILIALLSKYTPFGIVTQWFIFKVPGIGKLAREATIARFGVILGGLLKAGVPVVEALESLTQVTPIRSYKRLYAQLLARVAIGDSFSKCFATIRGSQKLLPASVQLLVITGEKSGSLADIMLKIADIYDKKASETAEKLPIILEPMLLLFIGALVGSIAFAIIIPIYSIVGSVGA